MRPRATATSNIRLLTPLRSLASNVRTLILTPWIHIASDVMALWTNSPFLVLNSGILILSTVGSNCKQCWCYPLGCLDQLSISCVKYQNYRTVDCKFKLQVMLVLSIWLSGPTLHFLCWISELSYCQLWIQVASDVVVMHLAIWTNSPFLVLNIRTFVLLTVDSNCKRCQSCAVGSFGQGLRLL